MIHNNIVYKECLWKRNIFCPVLFAIIIKFITCIKKWKEKIRTTFSFSDISEILWELVIEPQIKCIHLYWKFNTSMVDSFQYHININLKKTIKIYET